MKLSATAWRPWGSQGLPIIQSRGRENISWYGHVMGYMLWVFINETWGYHQNIMGLNQPWGGCSANMMGYITNLLVYSWENQRTIAEGFSSKPWSWLPDGISFESERCSRVAHLYPHAILSTQRPQNHKQILILQGLFSILYVSTFMCLILDTLQKKT
jgi:hypothetical protein